MADAVHDIMERMLPALEDLKDKHIFSAAELRSIVEKRRDFEYLLKRRATRKADFLRAINYEVQLERLRKLRKGRLNIHKASVSDFAGVQRVHFIFDRLLRKYRGDVDLWLQYIEYCSRSGAAKTLSKLFPRALRLHPHSTDLWVRAASWEFDSAKDMVNARVLLQRGLRFNPKSVMLWATYLRLELLSLQRFRAHLEVVRREETDDDSGGTDVAVPEDKVPHIVYDSAIEALPDNFELRLQCLEAAESVMALHAAVPRPLLPSLVSHICTSIAKGFAKDARAWRFLADRAVDVAQRVAATAPAKVQQRVIARAEEEALKLFDAGSRAVSAESLPDLRFAWVSFLETRIGNSTASHASKLRRTLHQVCDAGHGDHPDARLFVVHVDSLTSEGDTGAALAVARKACSVLPANADMWLLAADAAVNVAGDPTAALKELERGLSRVVVGSAAADRLCRRKAAVLLAVGAPPAAVGAVATLATAQGLSGWTQVAAVMRAFQ